MLKVNELFSGIGAQSATIKRLGIEFEVVGIAEIDKYAIQSYEAIHGKARNYGDISKIEKLDYADFWTYSFPCQDISVAGKQAGIEKHTRSGLLYEVERLLNVSAEHGELPKYLMLENVKNLVGKKFKAQFEEWLQTLDELGYNNYWKVLNAKNYGIPQNRERVFGISIRKDVDTGGFTFPEGFDNGLRLKDFLEDEVDEKFYISQEKTEKLISQLKDNPCITPDREEKRQNGRRFKEDGDPMFTLTGQDRHGILFGGEQKHQAIKTDGISTCLAASMGMGGGYVPMITEAIRLGGIFDGEVKHQAGAVWDKEGLCPTLDTMQGGYRQPSVMVKEATKQETICLNSKGGRNGIEGLQPSLQDRVYSEEGISTSLTTSFLPSVAVKEATKKGYAIAEEGDSINIQFPNSETRRGRVGKECAQTLETSCNQATLVKDKPVLVGGIGEKNFGKQYRQGNRVYDSEAVAMCLHAQPVGNTGGNSYLYQTGYRIRKLTPKECWRLMGFTDEEFQNAQDAGVSNSQR